MSDSSEGNTPTEHRPSQVNWALYIVLVLAAFLIPPALTKSDLPILGYTRGIDYQIFEFLGFTATSALFVIAGLEVIKRRSRGFAGLLPVFVAALVCAQFIITLSEYTTKSTDYSCYERAATAVDAGKNPYHDTGYIYPLLIADSLSGMHAVIARFVSAAQLGVCDSEVWSRVFYVWQCIQCLLAVAAYFLCQRFMRKLGAVGVAPVLLVAAIFLVNAPLVSTFSFNQPNLWMLVGILCTLIYSKKRPWAAGPVLAVATLVKIYPVALLLPLVVTKRWRMIVWYVVSLCVIVFLETGRQASGFLAIFS